MTQTEATATTADGKNLASLKLPELRALATEKGLKGISALRKGELITAILTGEVPSKKKTESTQDTLIEAPVGETEKTEKAQPSQGEAEEADNREEGSGDKDSGERHYESRSAARRARRNRAKQYYRENQARENERDNASFSDASEVESAGDSEERAENHSDSAENDNQQEGQGSGSSQRSRNYHDNDDRQGRRGRRGRRNRRNNRNGDSNSSYEQNAQTEELQDVAGILDIVDRNAAFVRTTGYRASSADVFVSNNLIKRFDLRSGDAITGQVRMNGGGHSHGNAKNRRKFNPLVRVDSVNGMTPEEAAQRPDFHKLTPLYPNQRLRLETERNILTTRVIDLVMPIGKGQRALIVSPPKAGKTTILQNIANAIATNNPECYLMVVLVDERPEEVTDMKRSVRGEVIASTFDRPPSEHTAVAELAIERAKRLVEMGQDVVVLLDSITRLGRAYNNSSPASGRILSGGVDSNALYPPKRFLGAARNIEDGGSLTIIATAMVETGSAGDTVIFEEFKGTGNAELRLDRKIAERRVFPAVDVNPSGTRKDELLMAPEEFRIVHKLRRILSGLESQQAIDLLIKQLKKTKSNGEFLMQVASSAPMTADKEAEDYL